MKVNSQLFPGIIQELLLKKVKLQGTRVELCVDDFIATFYFDKQNKIVIDKIKDLAKNGITIFYNKKDNYLENEIIEKDKLEVFEKAYKKATSYGIKCRFQPYWRYSDGTTYYPVSQLIKATKTINSWVDEINSARINGRKLTPFEKYLYAYEIVTEFHAKLNYNDESPSVSRHLIPVLNGDKIVCVRYESMLRHILNRVGIRCSQLFLEGINGHKNNHVVSLIYMQDKDYKINGMFVSEPTWGRDGEDYGRDFNYSFMSISQAKKMYKKKNLYLSDEKLLESKSDLFGSVNANDMLEYDKHLEAKRKVEFLDNFKGMVVNKDKFYKRATIEIKHIAKKLKLNQNQIAKDYRKVRFLNKNNDLIQKLVESSLAQFNSSKKPDKDNSSKEQFFDNKGLKVIEELRKSKYSVEEIAHEFTKAMDEYIKKDDEYKLNKYFGDFFNDIETISDDRADEIKGQIDKIRNAKHVANHKISLSNDSHDKKLISGLSNLGLAFGFDELGSKIFTVARVKSWNNYRLENVLERVERQKEVYKDYNLDEIERLF